MFGDKEFDLVASYYEQSLSPKMLDIIIEVTGYDKWKLILVIWCCRESVRFLMEMKTAWTSGSRD